MPGERWKATSLPFERRPGVPIDVSGTGSIHAPSTLERRPFLADTIERHHAPCTRRLSIRRRQQIERPRGSRSVIAMVHDIAAGHENGKTTHGRLLLTKLRAPRAASDGVVRDRLMREIDRGTEGKLTLIVTPPGYGKSTLVSQWHLQTERASAWLSLDNADND